MSIVFLLDVDNTLINNDAVKADLSARIEGLLGQSEAVRFWSTHDEVRRERDNVDFPRTLERFSAPLADKRAFAQVAALVLGYPYETSVYAGAPESLAHLRELGPVAIVSDGDPVFQPAKIARAGLATAVDRIFMTVHQERELARVLREMPAARYVLVDDKPRILAAVKATFGERVFTLHVCQGHYARAEEHHGYPPADRTIDAIADLARLTRADLGDHERAIRVRDE